MSKGNLESESMSWRDVKFNRILYLFIIIFYPSMQKKAAKFINVPHTLKRFNVILQHILCPVLRSSVAGV